MIYINKKRYILIISIFIIAFTLFLFPNKEKQTPNFLNATVINSNSKTLTIRDNNNLIYTLNLKNNTFLPGDNLVIEYTGLLDENVNLLNITPVSQDEEDTAIRTTDSIFDKFKDLANKKLQEMTLEEKIGQILLVKYPDDTNIKQIINDYKIGGFIFFEKDFKDKTTEEVQNMMNSLQKMSKISLLTAVDEEGGDVIRISSNKKLIETEFLSPRQLYLQGGFDLIREDTKRKSAFLEKLGINVNLAPSVDVSTNSTDYIYNRTLGENASLTSTYAKTVIEASKTNNSVSYVLKHFPGYSNNEDSHKGKVVDTRTLDEIRENDLPPFEAGIKSNAEAILVNHNIVQSLDQNNPASLSANVHNFLVADLAFTGITMTDDLSMKAVSSIENVAVKALLAGNDIIITTDYEQSFNDIKKAVDDGIISEKLINEIAHKIISWKYYKGLMYDKQK